MRAAREANVTVLTGPKAGAVYNDVVFNQVVLRAALKRNPSAGGCSARIRRGSAKPGREVGRLPARGVHPGRSRKIADRYFTTGEE